MFSTPSRFLKDMDERYLDRSGEKRQEAVPRWSRSWMEREFSRPATNFSKEFEKTPTNHAPKRLQKTTGMHVKSESRQIETPYPTGSRVRHATFGDGTVVRAMCENDNDKIVIRFDKAGEKTLLLKFARLERI